MHSVCLIMFAAVKGWPPWRPRHRRGEAGDQCQTGQGPKRWVTGSMNIDLYVVPPSYSAHWYNIEKLSYQWRTRLYRKLKFRQHSSLDQYRTARRSSVLICYRCTHNLINSFTCALKPVTNTTSVQVFRATVHSVCCVIVWSCTCDTA